MQPAHSACTEQRRAERTINRPALARCGYGASRYPLPRELQGGGGAARANPAAVTACRYPRDLQGGGGGAARLETAAGGAAGRERPRIHEQKTIRKFRTD